ncbi:TPA: hypothetical protein DDW69_02225 [candidate division CPR2 bacterium]|uniref:N-acetylmuramoyl-L-alanine amidase n=1 Tax=candidate division CPR2 bacterium GW2011_GWC1_41_48 TaxID=1618344 RepID=A0A0G0Z9X0_UNCC2|nr:MAG: Transglycosylase SLT domain protein [candidate division CPR2 bacterium GW2011_GWC2_39_35]KKR28410.1 MAG: Transglycosylase SLT domain protein [candidate division CPR2 bacterium GW2011_GWD1_39_7]KKS09843.1 MAG: Transglycosylase SLT domain protein [candidate division CPR2 bacterium GW2011_GWC1_41_48]OGB60670.1 MAG: hypothetical protein A2Y27_00535 [candidate division CPR2 bacterium GWD1_39_7]HBG81636.1 hypothetical protein [candidate division CPR2 bacterium]
MKNIRNIPEKLLKCLLVALVLCIWFSAMIDASVVIDVLKEVGDRVGITDIAQGPEEKVREPRIVMAVNKRFQQKLNVEIRQTGNLNAMRRKVPDRMMLHHTAGDLKSSQKWLTESKISCNYLIDKDGTIYVIVPPWYKANHAGDVSNSRFNNTSTIGVEFVNLGNGYDPYTDEQIKSAAWIAQKYDVPRGNVISHRRAARPKGRKVDPARNFPWYRLWAYAYDIDTYLLELKTKTDNEYYSEIVNRKAVRYGVSPALLEQLVSKESSWNYKARSRSGALGLGQVMPSTLANMKDANGNKYDLSAYKDSPDIQLDAAANYLSEQVETFGYSSLALAAYNAGPGAVVKYGKVPPYKETLQYVHKIKIALQESAEEMSNKD